MDKVICKNVYVTQDEIKKRENFNKIWIRVVNLILKY